MTTKAIDPEIGLARSSCIELGQLGKARMQELVACSGRRGKADRSARQRVKRRSYDEDFTKRVTTHV